MPNFEKEKFNESPSSDFDRTDNTDSVDDLSNKIVLHDENGGEIHFEFLDLINYRGSEYVVLLPCDDDDGEVVILRVEAVSAEEEAYLPVEDDDTLVAVFEIFRDKFADTFNFDC